VKVVKFILILVGLLILVNILRFIILPKVDSLINQKLHANLVNYKEPKNKADCLKIGSYWGKAGLFPKEFCRTPSSDFNKPCFSGFQCQWGNCVSQYNLRSQPFFAIGRCPKYRSVFGCLQFISFGMTNRAVCLD